MLAKKIVPLLLAGSLGLAAAGVGTSAELAILRHWKSADPLTRRFSALKLRLEPWPRY